MNPAQERKVEGLFARVTLPVNLVFTADLTGLNANQKSEIRNRVVQRLTALTDTEGKVKLDKAVEPAVAYAVISIPVMPESDSQGNPIFTLKGLKILDVFTGDVVEASWR